MSEDQRKAKPAAARRRRPAEEAAKAAILANPEFVFDDPDIMHALLAPSRPTSRKIVDLRTALVDRLERRLSRLVEAHRDVIDAAWDNLSGMEQAHQAALLLVDARSLDEIAAVVAERFPTIFELQAARLCIERAPERDSDTACPTAAIELLPPGFVGARLRARPRTDGPVAFSPIEPGDRAIFGADASKLGSVALIALAPGPDWPDAAIALGAADADRFRAGRNADLLSFVGRVAERRLARRLAAETVATAVTAG